jgi:hypothetical protein
MACSLPTIDIGLTLRPASAVIGDTAADASSYKRKRRPQRVERFRQLRALRMLPAQILTPNAFACAV